MANCSSSRKRNQNRKAPTHHQSIDRDFKLDESSSNDYDEIKMILVKIVSGKIISLKLKGSDTIGSMKMKIQAEEGIPIDQQELIFNGMIVDDSNTIANMCIKNGATLTLARTSRGVVMDVFIKMSEGKTVSLAVKPSYTISDVKAKITDVPVPHMLMFNGFILEDSCTLADFNIINGSTLTFVTKSGELMEIFVHTHTGKTISLSVNPRDIVANVKSKIAYEECIPVDEQVLIFNKMVLDDTATLFDFCIKRRSTLTLMRKSKGSNSIKIFIVTLTGATLTLKVKPLATITSIKTMIQQMRRIPCDKQELIFNNVVLENSATLADFQIRNESTLTLMRISTGFMCLYIKTLSKETLTLEVSPSDTIYNVKLMINDMENIPPYQQRLIYGGMLLTDNATLADLHIPNESTFLCHSNKKDW